jgi:hypothetical protein
MVPKKIEAIDYAELNRSDLAAIAAIVAANEGGKMP